MFLFFIFFQCLQLHVGYSWFSTTVPVMFKQKLDGETTATAQGLDWVVSHAKPGLKSYGTPKASGYRGCFHIRKMGSQISDIGNRFRLSRAPNRKVRKVRDKSERHTHNKLTQENQQPETLLWWVIKIHNISIAHYGITTMQWSGLCQGWTPWWNAAIAMAAMAATLAATCPRYCNRSRWDLRHWDTPVARGHSTKPGGGFPGCTLGGGDLGDGGEHPNSWTDSDWSFGGCSPGDPRAYLY